MRAPDRFHASFRKAEVLHLTFLNQVLHRSRHVFDRHRRINTMLIVEINGLESESLEGALGTLPDLVGPTLHNLLAARIDLDPELRGDHHLATNGREGFTHELFVGERAVDFSGVEECDATFYRGPDE